MLLLMLLLLQLRTFKIAVLSEVSALIEWMSCARPLRNCLAAKYTICLPNFRGLNETVSSHALTAPAVNADYVAAVGSTADGSLRGHG